MPVSNKAENHDPLVQELLDRTEGMGDDLEGMIDLTLETVVRVREQEASPETTHRKMVKQDGQHYFPIHSAGFTHERPIYSYLRYDLCEQFYDKRKMLLEALWLGIPGLRGGSDVRGLSARPNFGVVGVASIFDGTEVVVPTDTLPWVSKPATKEGVRKTIEKFDPDGIHEMGIFPTALDHTAYYRERLAGFDIGIGEVHNQSPFDVAHLVRGEQLFFDLLDDPPFVHELMEACTAGYLAAFRAIEKAAGRENRRNIPYCDDSSILVSEQLFEEFSLPYLYKLSEPFDSVYVHFCGKGHLSQYYLDCPKVRTINLGQPELFDYEDYMSRLLDAGKNYSGDWPALPEETTPEAYFERMLRPLKGREAGLNFQIQGYEFGMDSPDLCALWYEMQDRVLHA